METRLFSEEEENAIVRWWHYDEATDTVFIETEQRVDALLADNKALFADVDERANWGNGGLGKLVGRIPTTILNSIQRKNDPEEDAAAIKRLLNDRDYLHLRTRPGSL